MLFHRTKPFSDQRTTKEYQCRTPLITKLFRFSVPNDTPEDWNEHLDRTKNPKGLASPLLSCQRTFEDKVKILVAMPDSACEKHRDMRWLESRLEERGHDQLAQIVRWKMFWALDMDKIDRFHMWSQQVVEADIEARWIIQREAYIQEEICALKRLGDTDLVTNPQLNAYETELQRLNTCYWNNKKTIWKLEGNVPTGVVTRAFRACRADPNWYLSAWLRRDCAGRGGCCGRECGCCEKVGAHRGQHSRGHCTSACGCCIRTQGRLTSEYDRPSDMDDFPFDIDSYEEAYSKRIFQAYIWGLTFLDETMGGNYW